MATSLTKTGPNYDPNLIDFAKEGAVFVAPVGTVEPTGLAAYADPFVDLGYLSTDGIEESLDEYKADGRTYSYRMGEPDLKALPVSSYSATITVSPDGAGSKVSWQGRFYRGDTGNEPEEALSDEAGRTAMNRYFSNGLKGLKAAVEGGR